MLWYRIVFFHIFKFYYKDGNYTRDVPWFTATMLLAASTIVYLMSISFLIYFIITDEIWGVHNSIIHVFGFLIVAVNLRWFSYKDRYMDIYSDFKDSKVDKPFLKLLSWLYVLLGFLSIGFTAFIINSGS